MNGMRVALWAALLLTVVLCGCAGYFHYHPIKAVEEGGAKVTSEPIAPAFKPAISAAPVSEESLIK